MKKILIYFVILYLGVMIGEVLPTYAIRTYPVHGYRYIDKKKTKEEFFYGIMTERKPFFPALAFSVTTSIDSLETNIKPLWKKDIPKFNIGLAQRNTEVDIRPKDWENFCPLEHIKNKDGNPKESYIYALVSK